jgi:DNA polymerase delta subunit 1
MAAATDDFERSVQNGRQLALKVSCNSVYGFFGVSYGKGLMSCKPVAAVTTLKGRSFIEAAKLYVEKTYVGSDVLYGDTDSIMIKWGSGTSIPKAYMLAEEASAAITVLLRNGDVDGCSKPMLSSASSAITLANEKVYTPYLLIQKKNYAAMKYTLRSGASSDSLDSYECEMDMKGIDAVRRDRSKLVKSISESILDALLLKQDLNLALDSLKSSLMLVASQGAPLEWFILSKSLRSNYKTDNQPHVQAWKRMIERGDAEIPEIGTRMPFVIVETKSSGPLYTHTEHPDRVKSAKLRYDAKYYIENAQDVVERLLGPTGRGNIVRKIFVDALDAAETKSSGSMSLLSFKRKRAS